MSNAGDLRGNSEVRRLGHGVGVTIWTRVGAFIAGAAALFYLLTGQVVIGVAIAAGTMAVVVWRTAPAQRRGVPAGYGRSRVRLLRLEIAALVACIGCSIAFTVQGAIDRWGHHYAGRVAELALAGLELVLYLELARALDELSDERRGAEAEEEVAVALDPLQAEGWFIDHNRENPFGGNIDHVAVFHHGAFAIETKSGRYRAAAAGQAIGSMRAVREDAGVSWVTPVVCIPNQATPAQKGPVWVVGSDQLAEWLRTARLHRGRPIVLREVVARLSGDGSAASAGRITGGSA